MLKCALITNFYSEMYKKATYHELSTLEVLVGCWTKYSFLANLGGNMWQSFLGSQTSTARWSVHTWHAYKNVPSWINPGLEVIPRLSCWSVGSCCACWLPLLTQAVHLDFLRSSNLDVLIKQAVHLECKKKKSFILFCMQIACLDPPLPFAVLYLRLSSRKTKDHLTAFFFFFMPRSSKFKQGATFYTCDFLTFCLVTSYAIDGHT